MTGKEFFENDELQANRGFLYGDGVFETLRIFNGKMPFARLHYERQLQGAKLLGMTLTTQLTYQAWEAKIQQFIGGLSNCRVRVTILRQQGGHYLPTQHRPVLYLQGAMLKEANFSFAEKGLTLGVYPLHTLYPNPLSAVKTCNALPYILASMYAEQYRWDEALLLNHQEHIAEGAKSNLFIIKNKVLLTPPLTDGMVAGTMRRVVLKSARYADLTPVEQSLTVADLHSADEVFLTNAIQGIQWVQKFDTTTYPKPHYAPLLIQRLQQIVTKGQFIG